MTEADVFSGRPKSAELNLWIIHARRLPSDSF